MRQAKVPIDMSSEQKNLMGIVSTRQAIYIGIGGVVVYSYVPIFFNILNSFFGIITAIIICAITAAPVAGIVIYFGFFRVRKYNMFRDKFMLIKFQSKKNVGLWRK